MRPVKNVAQIDIGPVALRYLGDQDVHQCADIEKEAFPRQYPYTSFSRELGNQLANYLVAYPVASEEEVAFEKEHDCELKSSYKTRSKTFVGSLLDAVKARFWIPENETCFSNSRDVVLGFIGTWYMVDEAHIVSLGVSKRYQGRGVGELLLIGAIQHALNREASFLTLEVRPSNFIARNLYGKYGFEDKGVRKGYYSDDREDAIIMTTPSIGSSVFRDSFQKLLVQYKSRWGVARVGLTQT